MPTAQDHVLAGKGQDPVPAYAQRAMLRSRNVAFGQRPSLCEFTQIFSHMRQWRDDVALLPAR